MSTKNASYHLKRQQQFNRNLKKRAARAKKAENRILTVPKPGVRPISILSADHPMRRARSEEEWRSAFVNRDRSKWQ